MINNGAGQQAEPVISHDVKLPELHTDEELTSEQDMSVDCTAASDDNNFTSTAVMEDVSRMEENSISDGHAGPSAERAKLRTSADEPQETFASNQVDALVEKTNYFSPEFVQRLVDASVPVHSELEMKPEANNEMIPCSAYIVKQNYVEVVAVEGSTVPFPALGPELEAVEESIMPVYKLDTDMASEMDPVAEDQVVGPCSTSISNDTVAEMRENELTVEKSQENTDHEEIGTGISVMSGVCGDAEMKMDSDAAVRESSNQDEVLDAADDNDLHSVSECTVVNCDKGKELMDASDNRVLLAEETDVRNVSAADVSNEVDSHLQEEMKDLSRVAMECDKEEELVGESMTTTLYTEVSCASSVYSGTPVSVSSETVLFVVIADAVQEADDSAHAMETRKSEFTVVKGGKELEESANADDKPESYMEISCVRSMNVEAQSDAMNEIVLSETGDKAAAEVEENPESHCTAIDRGEDLVDECDKTATGKIQTELQVEVVLYEANADDGMEAQTSESKMQKPEELTLLQLSVNTPDSLANGQLQTENHCPHPVDIGLWADTALSCEAVRKTEVCSSPTLQTGSTDTVLERSLELEKQTDDVEPVVDAVVSSKQLATDNSVVDLNGNTLKESDSHDSALPHHKEQLKQPSQDGGMMSLVEMVADDVVEHPTHLDTAVDRTVHVLARSDGEISAADEIVSRTAGDVSPDVAIETVTMVDVQHYVKECESVASVPDFVLVPESESESDDVKAVPVSLSIPDSESESAVVKTFTACTSELVPESEAVDESVIPMSVPIPECEQAVEGSILPVTLLVSESVFESEAVKVSTVPVSALVPELADVEGSTISVVPSVLESELESEVVEFSEIDPSTDRSRTDETERKLHEVIEVMTASNVATATDAGIQLEDIEMEYNEHAPEDGRTLAPSDDMDTVVRLGKQTLDPSTEEVCVLTMIAASNSVESSDTEAQCVLAGVDHHEPKTDISCSDPLLPNNTCAARSENVLQHTGVISLVADDNITLNFQNSDNMIHHGVTVPVVDAVTLEDTVPSEMAISTKDGDAPRAETSVENVVLSSAMVTDELENASVSEQMVQTADANALCSEDIVHGRVTVLTGDEDAVMPAVEEDTIVSAKGQEDAVQHVVKDISDDTASYPDAVQDGLMTSTDVEDTAVHVVSSDVVAENAVSVSITQKDGAICADNLESAVQSRGVTVTCVTDEDTDVCVRETVWQDILISTDGDDVPVRAGGSENIERSGITTSMEDNNSAVNAEGLEDAVRSRDTTGISTADKDLDVQVGSSADPVHSGVVVSATNDDGAVTVSSPQNTTQNGVMIVTADEDITVMMRDPSNAGDVAESTVTTAVDQRPADDIMTGATSQFDSQPSNSSVEDGQFDDVESDDNIEPATPTSNHWRLCHASPTLRTGCRSSSLVSSVRRNLPVSPSHSSFSTPNSRRSSGTFAVSNRSMISTTAGQLSRHSPLLLSPIGQNIDRLSTRPRFPQSPITLHTGAHSSGSGLQVCANSPLIVGNIASGSDEKLRKRKRSADDVDISTKRSLVADFVDGSTTVVGQCDILPAEYAVISSTCDGDNATVTSAAAVGGTLAQAADGTSEKLQDVNEIGDITTLSQPVKSLLCSDSSSTAVVSDTQTIMSSKVMSEVIVRDRDQAPVEICSSVVDGSIPSHEDMTSTDSCLLRSQRLNSDTEESRKPEIVEDAKQGFPSVTTDISIDVEIVEGMETNAEECLTVNRGNDSISSQMDDVQSNVEISVADRDETDYCSQPASCIEHVDLAAECGSDTRTEVGSASDSPATSVTAGTSHDQCISDYIDKKELQVTSEVQPCCSSSITGAVVESTSCSLTVQAHADPMDSVTSISRIDNELSGSLSADMQKACTSAVSPLSEEHSNLAADSGRITSSQLQVDPPCAVDPLCNSSVSLQSETEGFDFEMRAAEASTATALTADSSFDSRCVSQAPGEGISASQTTDVCDVFPSQCLLQAPKSETVISCSQVNTNPDVDGLNLYLELSQEPSILGTSVGSQYVSQATKNEVNISCSQTTTNSDADGLHLYLEPSQDRSSLDALDRRKWNVTKHMKLLEMEDEVSTDGERSQETAGESDVLVEREDEMSTDGELSQATAGESDILMELRDGGISSQSTAGGQETTGEMADFDSELGEDNHCDLHVQKSDSELADGLGQEQNVSECDRTLSGCQESVSGNEQMTCGEGSTSLETGNTIDSVSGQSDMTDIPCESAVLNSYDSVEEFNAEEKHVLSVIAEDEEDCDRNATGSLTDKIDKRSDNGAFQDAEVTLMSVKACSPVKCDACIVAVSGDVVDGNGSYNNTRDDGLDVTESMSGADTSIDKDVDVAESSEKVTVCSPLEKEKSDVLRTLAAAEDDGGDDAGTMESIAGFGDSSEKAIDATPLCEKAVYLPVENDVCTVFVADADNASDDNEGDIDGLGVRGSTSNVDGSADEKVDVIRPSDNSAIYSAVKSGACVAAIHAADVGDPGDDDDDGDDDDNDSDDATASMSCAGSDVGHLSDAEENVPCRNDSVSALTQESVQPLLTKYPESVVDVQPEESFAGKYYVMLIFRSTPPSRPNTICLKCPSFRLSTKCFFNFNEIWYVPLLEVDE